MYGQNKYGSMEYAAAGENGKADEYYTDLFPLIPSFVSEKKEMHELYTTQGYAVGELRHSLEEAICQLFIETSTWGLGRWESVLGVETNLALTYEQRREILKARILGHGTTTVQMIKETAAAFSGGEVDVIEDNTHSRFIVRFIGIKGIPRNMQGFINTLEEIKPAHLAYAFEYRYTTWNSINSNVWNDFKELSWDGLRILKED